LNRPGPAVASMAEPSGPVRVPWREEPAALESGTHTRAA
jgi:hypothetical protein